MSYRPIKIAFFALTVISFLGLSVQAYSSSGFSDIDYVRNEQAIDYLYSRGVIEGYSDGRYLPYSNINRAEFVKIVMEAKFPGESNGDYCFVDVESQWFADYVCEAYQRDIVDGYGDGTFGPGDPITLVEALKVVLETYELEVCNDCYSRWYEAYYWFAEPKGLLEDISDDAFHELTRGEMAQLIYNIETHINGLPDVAVIDLYVDNEDLYVEIGNTGGTDIYVYDHVEIRFLVDWDEYWVYDYMSFPGSEFHDIGTSGLIGPLPLPDGAEHLRIELDTLENVDEENEDNNITEYFIDEL